MVFDAFLSEYPLCYGYWKKYADLELRSQLPEVATAVYERGVAATPYSPDLWAHYAMFKKAQPGVTPDEVRRWVTGCGVLQRIGTLAKN